MRPTKGRCSPMIRLRAPIPHAPSTVVERRIPLWCQPQAALHVSPEPDGAELGTLNPSSSDCLSLSSVPLISDSSGCHRLAKYCDPRILGQSIPGGKICVKGFNVQLPTSVLIHAYGGAAAALDHSLRQALFRYCSPSCTSSSGMYSARMFCANSFVIAGSVSQSRNAPQRPISSIRSGWGACVEG